MIVATLCARDEQDIIGRNIEHHLASGVDKIILTDNGSVDRTVEIAQRYPEVEIISKPVHDYRHGEWVTSMARQAYKMGAKWVANIDADEFWYGLPEANNMVDSVSIIRLPPNYDYLPLGWTPSGPFDPSQCPFFTRSQQSLRFVHRAMPDVIILDGNHDIVNCPGGRIYTKKIWMKHYSIRNFEQFSCKVIKGGTALEKSPQTPDKSTHWRHWYKIHQEGRLKDYYDSHLALNFESCYEQVRLGKLKAKILL